MTAARGSFSGKTLLVAVGTGIQTLISQMGVNLFLVRLLDPSEFAGYRQIWLLIHTVLPIALLGLHFALYYFLTTLPGEARRGLVVRVATVLSLLGAGLAVAGWVSAPALARFLNHPEVADALRIGALYVAFALPTLIPYHLLIAEDRAGRAVFWNLTFFLPQSVMVVLLAWAGYDLRTLFLAMTGLGALRWLVMWWVLARETEGPWWGRGIDWKPLLAYGIPVGMTSAVAILGEKLDKFVVSAHLDPESFALYAVGAVEFPAIVLLSAAAITVMRPRIAALHHEGRAADLHRFWQGVVRKLALVIVPAALYLALFADELMILLYTDAYSGAASIFRIYLLLAVFRIVPPEPLLSSTGRTRTVFLGGLGFLVLDLALNLVLVRQWGLVGPPWATVIATAALVGFYGHMTARALEVPTVALIPAGPLVRVLAAALPATLVALWLVPPAGPAVRLGLGAVVFLVVYPAAALALKAFRIGELTGILSRSAGAPPGNASRGDRT